MKVKIYSTQLCPWCHKAADFLRENNIEFEEFDIGKDKEAKDEMIAKSGQTGVPVIDIDGKIIIGFDKEAIKSALGI